MLEMFNLSAMYVAIQAVLSLRFVTHVGLCDGLWRRCAAHCSHQRSVEKPLSLFVETYGTEIGSMLADDTTFVLEIEIEFDCRNTRRRLRTAIKEWEKHLAPPVRKYSVRIGGEDWRIYPVFSLVPSSSSCS